MDLGILDASKTGFISPYSVPVISKALEILEKANKENLFAEREDITHYY